jgi:transglutaminase-like putative cysteine protease
VTIAAVGASALAAAVPQSGTLQWRTQSGIGTGLYGSGSFNQFVGLQQSLLNLSDDPMFYARVNDSAPSQLYWRLLTLDTFDGRFWSPSDQTFARRGDPRWENPEWSFRGPTAPVAANVLIAGLKTSEFLPTLYSPVGLTSEEPLISEGFRVREDGSVAVDLRVLESWTYQINAEIPQPELAALASVDGALSGTFAAAVAAGELDLEPAPGTATERPESLDAYTELPEIDEALGELARSVTAGATTPFERAVLLETFLRDPALGFTYSTQVDTGHSALDLTEWLTEPDSRNFRTGYCEQFATAMAVMGRMLRIPTRVVLGFTPGSIEQQADGTDIIVVRERNAHAWVEMWMDGQGWVKFDPTPLSDSPDLSLTSSRVGVDLRPFVPEPTALSATPGVPQIPREDLIDPGRFGAGSDVEGLGGLGGSLRRLSSWALVVLVLAALVALVPGAKYMRRRRRLARMSDGEVEAAWAEIVDRLADLGVPPDPADTPLEMARAEDHDLVPLALLYEAAAYGGRTAARCLPAFEQAERNLRTRYSGGPWTKSWVSLESVAPRRLLRFSLRTRQRSSRR